MTAKEEPMNFEFNDPNLGPYEDTVDTRPVRFNGILIDDELFDDVSISLGKWVTLSILDKGDSYIEFYMSDNGRTYISGNIDEIEVFTEQLEEVLRISKKLKNKALARPVNQG